ncbi:MAG TPA: MGMT family protein [Acidimicrobiales bacterium]|nr:MGMT family protein [Acidimicrobiales bacterium]
MSRSGGIPSPSGWREARILERVTAIPEGFGRTYGDIDPAAPRLVGRVLATAPEDLPWHRVVRADGSLPVGAAQLARLRGEGVPFCGDRVDLAHARMPK